MPINLSDQALSEFDKLPDNEKHTVISNMPDADAHQFADYYPQWKEQKQSAQFAGGQIKGFESPTAQMSIGSATPPQVPVNPYVGAGAQNPYTLQPDEIQHTKETVIDPAITKFQKGPGDSIAKGLMSGYGAAEDVTQKFNKLIGVPTLTPEERSRNELLGYEALSWLGGPDLVDRHLSEMQKLKGVNSLADSFGTEGAAFVQGLAHYGGQAPLFLIGGGKGAQVGGEIAEDLIAGAPQLSKLVKALTQAGGRVAGSAVEGAAVGAGQALLTPGADLTENAKYGALLGAGAGALGEAAPYVIKQVKNKAKLLAITSRLATSDIANEVESVFRNAQKPAISEELNQPVLKLDAPEHAPVVEVKPYDKDFRPGWFNVVVGDDDKLYSVFSEMRKGQPHIKQAKVPLQSLDDAIAHGKLVEKFKVDGAVSDAALAHPDLKSEYWRIAAPIDVEEAARANLIESLQSSAEGTKVARPGARKPKITDEIIHNWESRPSAVLETSDGRMEIRRLPQPKEPAAPVEVGDNVELPIQGGTVRARVKDTRGATVILDVPGVHKEVAVEASQVLHSGAAVNTDQPVTMPGGRRRVTEEMPQVGGGAGTPPISDNSVYAGRGVEEDLKRGTLMGQDPASPENVQVRLHNGEIISLAKNDVFKLKIPKDLVPMETPHDGMPLDVNQVPAAWASELQLAHDLVTYAKGKPGVMEVIDKQLMNPALYQYAHGTVDAANALSLGQAMRNVSARDEVLHAFKQQFKGQGLLDQFSKDVGKAKLGKMSLDELWEKHPEAAKQGQEFVQSLFKEIDDNSKQLESLGFVPENYSDLRDAGEMDKYMANMYRAHWMGPEEWLKIAPPKVIDGAIRRLQKEYPEKFPHEIAQEISDMLKLGPTADAREKLFASSSVGSKWRNLEARKNIPPEIKALLGEEDSGFIRLAHTVGNQRLLIQNAKLWKSVVDNPELWSPGPQVTNSGRWEKVPANKNLYGEAAGGYVPQELKPLIDAPNTIQNADTIWRSIAGWRKGNLTAFGGMAQWMNNAKRNIKNMVLAGGLDVFHPVESGKSFLDAVKQLSDWKKLPVNSNQEHPITMWRRLGVDTGGFASNEMKGRSSEIKKALDKELGTLKDGSSIWDIFEKTRDTVERLITNKTQVHETLKSAYDYTDRVMKIASANQITRRLQAEINPNTGARWSFDEATREAAWRVKAMFPDFQNVGKFAEKARDSIGVFAPFTSAYVENLRIMRMIPTMLEKDPSMKYRMLAALSFMGASGYAMSALRRANGISDAEVAASVDDKKLSKKYYRPGMVAAPYRDAKGRVELHDASSWIDELQFLNGDPNDPWYQRVAGNSVLQLMGGGTDPALQKLFNNVGLMNSPQPTDYKPLEGERGPGLALKGLYDMGFAGPKAPGNLIEDMRRGGLVGQTGKTEEVLTPRQTVMRMMGIKSEPYTLPGSGSPSPSHRGSVHEQMQEFRDLGNKLKEIGYSKRTPEEKHNLRRAELEEFHKQREAQRQVNSNIRSAQEQRKQ